MKPQRSSDTDRVFDGIPRAGVIAHTERAAWCVLVLHALVIGADVLPWYHPVYRTVVQLANLLLWPASAWACLWVLLPRHARGRRLWPAAACLTLATGIVGAGVHRNDWRVSLTDRWIQAHHCTRLTDPQPPPVVLGGIKRAGGLGAGQQVFINDSHCTGARCAEELFECRSR
jgi:hypothetical protein